MLRGNIFILYTTKNHNCMLTCLPFSYLDPCDDIDCNGTLAECVVIYSTGAPKCTCPKGYRGDPQTKCGK